MQCTYTGKNIVRNKHVLNIPKLLIFYSYIDSFDRNTIIKSCWNEFPIHLNLKKYNSP